MSRRFSEKWGTECPYSRLPLSTLLYARYSEALKKKIFKFIPYAFSGAMQFCSFYGDRNRPSIKARQDSIHFKLIFCLKRVFFFADIEKCRRSCHGRSVFLFFNFFFPIKYTEKLFSARPLSKETVKKFANAPPCAIYGLYSNSRRKL